MQFKLFAATLFGAIIFWSKAKVQMSVSNTGLVMRDAGKSRVVRAVQNRMTAYTADGTSNVKSQVVRAVQQYPINPTPETLARKDETTARHANTSLQAVETNKTLKSRSEKRLVMAIANDAVAKLKDAEEAVKKLVEEEEKAFFIGDETIGAKASNGYVGCVVPSGWVRPYGNVALSGVGALDCKSKCSNGGYAFFGLECPMGSQVHCQCNNVVGGTTKSVEYCRGLGSPLVHPHNHCVGPYEMDGYLFGDYTVGSVYDVSRDMVRPPHGASCRPSSHHSGGYCTKSSSSPQFSSSEQCLTVCEGWHLCSCGVATDLGNGFFYCHLFTAVNTAPTGQCPGGFDTAGSYRPFGPLTCGDRWTPGGPTTNVQSVYDQNFEYGVNCPSPTPGPAPLPGPCTVTVYDHWPEVVDLAGVTGLNAAKIAWGGRFPTGAKTVLHGTGNHSLGSFANKASSVKVEGACCKAKGHTSADCSGTASGVIAASETYLAGLPAGVVATRSYLTNEWSCNDCHQCVEVIHEC